MTEGKVEDFLPQNLAKAIQEWIGYKVAVNMSHTLAEDTLKIPVCDYLLPYMGIVELEKNIPIFCNRQYDLYFKNESMGLECFFEFKYAQKGFMMEDEHIQRVFYDLLRLNAADNSVRRFFIMCGQTVEFNETFKEFDRNGGQKNNVWGSGSYKPDRVYEKMFDFKKIGGEKVIDNNDSEINTFKKNFIDEYKLHKKDLNQGMKIEDVVEDISHVKTKLVYLQSRKEYPAAVGIWEIVHT